MNEKIGNLEPWQWPEEHWRRLVSRVRAGRSLRPKHWKGGAKCVVALSFNSDHDTSELRDGGKSIGRLAWGQYGNRVGVPRILALLEKYGAQASFYVPAVTAMLYPDEQKRIVDGGHEIGIHGWIHELNSVLAINDERDLMLRSLDAIEKITGQRPYGLRSPSADFSENTLRLLQETGLEYNSSLGADDDCYELLINDKPSGIVRSAVRMGSRRRRLLHDEPLSGSATLHARRPTCSTSSSVNWMRPTRKVASITLRCTRTSSPTGRGSGSSRRSSNTPSRWAMSGLLRTVKSRGGCAITHENSVRQIDRSAEPGSSMPTRQAAIAAAEGDAGRWNAVPRSVPCYCLPDGKPKSQLASASSRLSGRSDRPHAEAAWIRLSDRQTTARRRGRF